jgi:hypothetical protein
VSWTDKIRISHGWKRGENTLCKSVSNGFNILRTKENIEEKNEI